MKNLICMGIESTAHTFGISIVSSEGKILTNVNSTLNPHLGSGIHPREAAQHHCIEAPKVLKNAIEQSGISLDQIDIIAFSLGPGLGPVLRTGATVARAISIFLKKPLVPVHHAIGHIELACLMSGAKNPLTILVSGGHTMIIAFVDKYWRVYGETEDITLGNLLDTFAREANLPFPGGASIENLAKKSNKYINFPYMVKGNDVSYSGLLTSALAKLKNGSKIEDICYSIQEVSFSMLTEASERALAHTEKKEILLAGGVAINKRLRQMLHYISDEHGSEFFEVPKEYSGDCGAQIAWTGILAYKSGVVIDVEKSIVIPKWRLDEVYIPWR